MPLHWIYNQADIATKVGAADPVFFGTPSCPFYSYPLGVFSPYGDEALPLLHSMAESGAFDKEKASKAMYEFYKTYTDTGDKGYAGRLNHAPKSFVEARDEGKTWSQCSSVDHQANGIAKVPLIVARYAGSPDLSEKIEQMVGILQDSQTSKESSLLVGKLLERIIFRGEEPLVAMQGLLADADLVALTVYQRNILSFVLDDNKIRSWMNLSAALAALPELATENFRRMKIGVMAMEEELNPDLGELDTKSEEDKLFLKTARINAENKAADVTNQEITVNAFASAVGLSCMLPCKHSILLIFPPQASLTFFTI